jgi:hypothetical protein
MSFPRISLVFLCLFSVAVPDIFTIDGKIQNNSNYNLTLNYCLSFGKLEICNIIEYGSVCDFNVEAYRKLPHFLDGECNYQQGVNRISMIWYRNDGWEYYGITSAPMTRNHVLITGVGKPIYVVN